jgi:hypothetical protein
MTRNAAALFLLPMLLQPLLLSAQEVVSADSLPPSIRDGYVPPDRILYGSFLRSVAVFEKRAQEKEAQGLSGDAYRRHFVHKLGISATEQQQISQIALRYYDRWSTLKAQLNEAVKQFRAENFPGSIYEPVYDANGRYILPATPPEIAHLGAQLDLLTQASRDEIHSALGDSRFAYLDSALRARASRDFETLKSLHSGSAQ